MRGAVPQIRQTLSRAVLVDRLVVRDSRRRKTTLSVRPDQPSDKREQPLAKSMLQLQHRIDIEGTDKGMHEKAEEFLNTLLWGMDMLARPTLRNLTSYYEQWAYRNGFPQQVGRLEQADLLTRDQRSLSEQLYSLTKAGRLHALGGRDPEERWSRPWDGVWRLVLFDLPNGEVGLRDKFRRLLRLHYLGCLQRSVWVCPDEIPDVND